MSFCRTVNYSPFTSWLIENGLPEKTIELLVAITIVATIVSIFRYILGTKSYGIYAPIILAIAYSYTGLKYGLATTIVVILTTLLSHYLLRKIRMHYITRIAINYCLLTMAITGFILIAHKYKLGLENISNIPPLALISIATLSDFFIKQLVQKSFKSSLTSFVGTLLVATVGWFVITREFAATYVINNLWIVPALIVFNLLIGQFRGLRLSDYFRFKSATKIKKDD